jgi:hypothetical protein
MYNVFAEYGVNVIENVLSDIVLDKEEDLKIRYFD